MPDSTQLIACLRTELVGSCREVAPQDRLRQPQGSACYVRFTMGWRRFVGVRGPTTFCSTGEVVCWCWISPRKNVCEINDRFEVVVLDVEGNHVRLGVLCSPDNGASNQTDNA